MASDSELRIERATAFLDKGLYAEAEFEAMQIGANDDCFPRALHIAGLSLVAMDREGEAINLMEYASVLAPDDADIFYSLGVEYQQYGDQDRALLAYQACLRNRPDHMDAMWNYAEILRVQEHFSEALKLLEQQQPLLPKDRLADFYHRLGVTYFHMRRYQEGANSFENAIKLKTSEPDLTEWEYSHLLLAMGEWRRGWRAYDHRFAAGYKTSVACHDFGAPWWEGQSVAGKTLLVHGEQGLGDEIMFGQIVPELVNEGANIIWACQSPLVRLFAESNPDVVVISHQVMESPADIGPYHIDMQVAIGSLGRWRRRTDDEFKVKKPAYRAAPERAKLFAERLLSKAPLSKDKLKVGLMWGANPSKNLEWGRRRSLQKSIPIELLKPLARFRKHIQFVSLQNSDAGVEAVNAPELDIVDFNQELLNMSDTAALIHGLDLVITVDTSIAHLAGGMGKHTWVLLMNRADWRWGHGGDKSIWYMNTRLLRQDNQGDWRPVIKQLEEALQHWTVTMNFGP